MMEIKKIILHKNYSSFMLLFIMCYAFFTIGFQHIGNFFLSLILLGTLPVFAIYKKEIVKNPVFIVFLLLLLVQILSWINSILYLPDLANALPAIDRLGKLFVFFFIAYWLKGSVKNIVLLWLFFIFGFLFACTVHADFIAVSELVANNERVDFSIKNSQFDSMLAGTALVMLVSLLYIIKQFFQFSTYKVKVLSLFGTLFFIGLFLYIVLITQSRQVWLGLISTVGIGVVSYMLIYKVKSIKVVITIMLILFGMFFLLNNSQIVQNRLLEENKVFHALLEVKKPLKMTSIGVRVNSWLDAYEWIKEHPIIGLDSEAIPEVIQRSKRFNETLKKKYGHLHNFFIETVVAYGLSGLILILALYYLVIRSVHKSTISENEKRYFLLLSICFISYWLIINNFEAFNSRWLGVFTHNIILASFYTFYLASSLHLGEKQSRNRS